MPPQPPPEVEGSGGSPPPLRDAATPSSMLPAKADPSDAPTSASGKPLSSSVGTLSNPGMRRRPQLASTRNAPDFTCGVSGPGPEASAWTWPARIAVIAGPPPWKGTCSNCTPAAVVSIAIGRWSAP